MTTFTIAITDPSQLAGLTAARESYNAALPGEIDKDGKPKPVEGRKGYLATDREYLQTRVADLLASYARQHGLDVDSLKALESNLEARRAKMRVAGITG